MFEQYDWKNLLEKYETAAYFVVPAEKWDLEHPEEDLLSILRGPYAHARSCQYYAANYDAVYVMGLGCGAGLASLLGILFSSTFAAFAAVGKTDISEKLLDKIAALPTNGNNYETKADVAIPAWIADGSEEALPLVNYLKKVNHVIEEDLSNSVARVWKERYNTQHLCVNEQPVAEVWYCDTIPEKGNELAEKMLAFVTKYKRWGGAGNGHLRRTISPGACGLILREIMIDGLKRHWYVYEPTAYKKNLKDTFPMVMAIHGYSCSGAFYMENSSWQAVAEERGIIVAFPSGYTHKSLRTNMVPTAAWSSFIDMQPQETDDVKFLTKVVELMTKDYPIDKTRIYVTGHSNGSGMTQKLMREAPNLFAAFAGIGAMEATMYPGKIAPPMPDDMIRPVWYIMGERDLFEADSLEPGTGNYNTIQNACACNRADYAHAAHYTSGIYRHLVAYDKEHRPLVRFTGIDRWPHTVTPETSMMIYDEFFCKYRRLEDGSSEYIG